MNTRSKLAIIHGSIVPVLCDLNNFCLSLKDNLKLGKDIQDYPLLLSEYFLNKIQVEEVSDDTFYLGISREDAGLYEYLFYRKSMNEAPEPVTKLVPEEGEIFIALKEIKPNILGLK